MEAKSLLKEGKYFTGSAIRFLRGQKRTVTHLLRIVLREYVIPLVSNLMFF